MSSIIDFCSFFNNASIRRFTYDIICWRIGIFIMFYVLYGTFRNTYVRIGTISSIFVTNVTYIIIIQSIFIATHLFGSISTIRINFINFTN